MAGTTNYSLYRTKIHRQFNVNYDCGRAKLISNQMLKEQPVFQLRNNTM